MRISIGSDYRGQGLKHYLIAGLCSQPDIVVHRDSKLDHPADYYAIVGRLARLLRAGAIERAVLLCANTLGATMYADKQPGVRAAHCQNDKTAQDGVYEHNMNLLVLGVQSTKYETASSIVDIFLRTQCSSKLNSLGIPADRLACVVEHIESNLDQPLDVARLANLIRMSPSHFSKLFKMSLGISPHQFILHQRVARSKELLRKSPARIVDIAFAVGFETQAHFTTVFGNLVGMTPKQFRHRTASNPPRSPHNSILPVRGEISTTATSESSLVGHEFQSQERLASRLSGTPLTMNSIVGESIFGNQFQLDS